MTKADNTQASPTPKTSSTPVPSISQNSSKDHAGAIAGGVVGGIVGLTLIALVGFLLWRHRAQPQKNIESWSKPELPENSINPHDKNIHEKDAYQTAELDPANRFELEDNTIIHEIDASQQR